MPRKITLDTARRRGLKHYFTGKPCSRGHVARRYVASRACVVCNLARVLAHSKTPKGRATMTRYRDSPKGRENARRARQSPKGRERQRAANQSPKGRERTWRYNRSDHGRTINAERERRRPSRAKYQRDKRLEKLIAADPMRAQALIARRIKLGLD